MRAHPNQARAPNPAQVRKPAHQHISCDGMARSSLSSSKFQQQSMYPGTAAVESCGGAECDWSGKAGRAPTPHREHSRFEARQSSRKGLIYFILMFRIHSMPNLNLETHRYFWW